MKTKTRFQRVLDRMSDRLGLPAKIANFIAGQQSKFVLLTAPAAVVDNASLTVAELDCLGWDYAEIFVVIGATDIALSALTLLEGDVSGNVSAVTAGTWGTADNHVGTTSTLPSATDDNKAFKFELDLRKRKRYLNLTVTVGNGTSGAYVTVFAILSRGRVAPYTAAEAGCAEIIRL